MVRAMIGRLPWKRRSSQSWRILEHLIIVTEGEVERTYRERQQGHPNPLTRYGRKCFSQADEDGITFEIIRRLGIEQGSFAEFGVGDGSENCTLSLLALGWTGFWVGGEELCFSFEGSQRLAFLKAWITRENVHSLYTEGLAKIRKTEVDVIFLDLDGNDIYLVETLLDNGTRPKIFVVEYNAKFIPPIRFRVAYDAARGWEGDDYYGASLCSYSDVMEDSGYRLVCCNAATGVNAFFVRNEYAHLFSDVPTDISQIYAAPYFRTYPGFGHRVSPRTLARIAGAE